jgi:hypothetical protein
LTSIPDYDKIHAIHHYAIYSSFSGGIPMKKHLSLLLALLMLTQTFVSCADSNESADTEEDAVIETAATPSAEETVPEETEISRAEYPDTLPDGLDFNGATVTIHSRGDDEPYYEIWSERMTGEVVNDAIFERNAMVSERLNVEIEAYKGEAWDKYNNAVAAIRSSVMASDGAYDAVAGWSARIPALSLEGLLLDLNDMEYLDFGQPWWNQSAVEELQIAGHMHFVTGHIAKTMLSSMGVYIFNQKVAADYNIENLYDVVREHRWTSDYVYELSSGIYTDLDGNGEKNAADMYGLATSAVNEADGYMQGFRVSMVSRDEEGLPVLDVDTERLASVVESVYKLMWDNPGCYAVTSDGTDLMPFAEDRVLLVTTLVREIVLHLADMESDYGILPYPLLNDAQSEYGTRVADALSLWCIPIDSKDPEMTSAVLEALAAQSYRTVTPAYFDVALKSRYSRDPQTAEMMDLIEQSALINFEALYNESIGNPWFVVRSLMQQKSNNFASYWASNSKVINKKLGQAVAKIQEND